MLKFLRKKEVRAQSGLGKTEFDDAVADGRFPPPDAYLGPRSPVWTEDTVAGWQGALIEAHKNKSAKRRGADNHSAA
jgi:predicted DNA-binding transcriptional regulator AlpA